MKAKEMVHDMFADIPGRHIDTADETGHIGVSLTKRFFSSDYSMLSLHKVVKKSKLSNIKKLQMNSNGNSCILTYIVVLTYFK